MVKALLIPEQFVIPPGPRPVFVRLADAVREDLRAGKFRLEASLPSTRELAAHLGIHRHTVRAALDQLVAEGWLVVEERRGYVVCAGPESSQRVPSPHRFRFVVRAELAPFAPLEGVGHNFQSGIPDLRLFPADEFRACLNEACRTAGASLLDYSHPSGWPRLKSAVAAELLDRRGIAGRDVIVTNGSQEAIYLALRLLIRPGDDVAVEALTYPPARETLRLLGAKIHALPLDDEGLDPAAFERLARRRKLRLLFVTPTHQFPTTINLAAERRLAILRIASAQGIPVLEDDYDHEFHYQAEPPRSLAALDDRGLVLYLSTFSKVVFPSARLAFMAVPTELGQRICQLRRLTTHQNDTLIQAGLALWMEAGGYQRHVKRMRRVYEERRDHLDTALKGLRAAVPTLRWQSPPGGMATWVDLAQDSTRLATRARAAGIFISAEGDYRARGEGGTHVRLGFAHLDGPAIRAGIDALGAVLAKET